MKVNLPIVVLLMPFITGCTCSLHIESMPSDPDECIEQCLALERVDD